MPSESLDCPSIAARMRLEWSWSVPTRVQECPECTSNAVGIFRLPLECGSNAVRMHLECPDQEKKRMTRMHLECISIAMGIYLIFSVIKESNWNALRMPSESGTLDCSNAARMQFDCPDYQKKNDPNSPRMHLECRRNLFRYSRYLNKPTGMHFECRRKDCPSIAARMRLEWSWNVPTRVQECPECTSNAVGIFRLPLECGSNAVRMHLECPDQEKKRMTRIHLECISIAAEIVFRYSRYLKNPTGMHFECRRNL